MEGRPAEVWFAILWALHFLSYLLGLEARHRMGNGRKRAIACLSKQRLSSGRNLLPVTPVMAKTSSENLFQKVGLA